MKCETEKFGNFIFEKIIEYKYIYSISFFVMKLMLHEFRLQCFDPRV